MILYMEGGGWGEHIEGHNKIQTDVDRQRLLLSAIDCCAIDCYTGVNLPPSAWRTWTKMSICKTMVWVLKLLKH